MIILFIFFLIGLLDVDVLFKKNRILSSVLSKPVHSILLILSTETLFKLLLIYVGINFALLIFNFIFLRKATKHENQ